MTARSQRSVRDAFVDLRDAQKGHARGAPAYSVYVNRRIGRLLAAVGYRLGLTPNQATIVSAAHTFLAIALLATVPVSWTLGVVVSVLLVLGYAWDSADGQIARLRGGGTIAGEWLDHVVDAFKIASIHLAALIGLYRFGSSVPDAVLLIPLGFSVVATVTFFGMLLNDLLKAARGLPSTHARGGGSAARSLVLLPTDFGMLCLVFVLWGSATLFLVVYAALFAASTLFLALACVKWFREMRRVE